MASSEDFWFIIYELNILEHLEDIPSRRSLSDLSDADYSKLKDYEKKVKKLDYEKMNMATAKLYILPKRNRFYRKRLRKEYKEAFKEYLEIGTEGFTSEKGYHIIFFISYSEPPTYISGYDLYDFLTGVTFLRNKKSYPVTKDMVLELFSENPEYYREVLFLDQDIHLTRIMNSISNVFQRYIDQKYPIKHKQIKFLDNQIECNESKHGILRGLVHKIGYIGYEEEDDEYLMKIINSGYLEIQFNPRNPNSGIFTTIIGRHNTIDSLYFNNPGIYFIISLAALDDFDYWAGVHDLGSREVGDLYKGICHKCDKKTEQYSAAERCYIEMYNSKFNTFYELMISSDVNIKRYVEQIYVTPQGTYDNLMKSDMIPPWVKSLLIYEEDKTKIYNLNCKKNNKKPISEKKFEELAKDIAHNKKFMKPEDIPLVNYTAINEKRKLKINYDPLHTPSGIFFPILEQKK